MKEKWSSWIVPKEYCSRYIFLLLSVLFILPLITGLRYTIYGYMLNIFWADLIFFMWYKRRKIKEIELAQKKRRDKYLNGDK